MERTQRRHEASTNGDPSVGDGVTPPRERRRSAKAGHGPRPGASERDVGQALVVLSREGTILSEYGLVQWIPDSELREGGPSSLASLLRFENRHDLREALSSTFASGESSPPAGWLSVVPAVGARDQSLRLALYRFDETRCIGVLSEDSPAESDGLVTSLPLLQAWSGLRDAMVLASIPTRTGGPRILAVNEAFLVLFGLSEGEPEGTELIPLLAADDDGSLRRRLRSLAQEGGGSMTSLSVLDTPAGEPRLVEWELAPIRDSDGRALSLIGVLGEARSSSVSRSIRGLDPEQMAEASSRLHFLRRVERTLERVRQRPSQGFAVLGLEVDEGPDVRDRLGDAVGEAVLDAFAWRVQRTLRPEDLVARIGPYTLGVLLDGFASTGGVGGVVDRIEEATEDPFTFAGETIWLSRVKTSGLAYRGRHLPESAQEILAGLD